MRSSKFKTVTTINGKFVKRGQDKISVFDNSLLYAEGLFETMLAIEGRILFADEHFRRMKKGSRILGIKIPVTKKILWQWMEKTVNAHPDKVVKLRLTLTSGEAARWVGSQGKQQVILSASPHEIPFKPYTLFVSDYRIDQESIFRRVKTISYAIHAAALNQAKKHKCEDALMINGKNQVAEVTSANIFWVKNNKIFTTPLTSGCLEGITREYLIAESRKIGYNITERNITIKNLLNADEVFISSSLKLVLPVMKIKIKEKTYSMNRGEITEIISGNFRKSLKLEKK